MPLNLYKREKTGIWYIRGNVQDEYFDQSARTRSRREAEQIRAKIEAASFKRQVYGADAVATFSEAVVAYINAGGDGTHLTPLLDAFGTRPLREIGQAEIDALAKERKAAPATLVRQLYTPLAAVLNFAASDTGGKLCQPVRFRKPKVRNARTEFLTPAEAEAWLTALPPYLARLVTFYLATGCRASEALDLKWKDISGDRAVFWETKSGYARSVTLQARVAAVLGDARAPDDPVFLNQSDEPWHGYDAINLMLKRHGARNATLRPVHCHLFRHTWATWAYACTRDLTFLMGSGGWRSLSMVGRYTHLASADLAREVLAKGWEFHGRELPGFRP